MMKKILVLLLFLLMALPLLTVLPLQAQTSQRVDFETFPQRDADYDHLRLELAIDEDLSLQGEAVYELNLLRNDVDSLRLDAVRMDIQTVEWNDSVIEFRMEEDKLVVRLPESAGPEKTNRLRIRYQAQPAFGVFRAGTGTIWTSGMPGSVRHWLPVVDHPRNSFTSEVTLIFPAEKEVVFTGIRGEESVMSVDEKSVRFRANAAFPASAMRFAIGDFEQSRRMAGRYEINLHVETGLLSDQEKEALLEDASETFLWARERFRQEYPSPVLNIVVLKDDMWESKHYGSGVVLAFANQQELTSQVRSGVISQWAGIQMREEAWRDSEAILLLQSWALHQLNEEVFTGAAESHASSDTTDMEGAGDSATAHPLEGVESTYTAFSPDRREKWSRFFLQEDSDPWRDILTHLAGDLIAELPEVINWYDFSRYLYLQTGMNFEERPELPDRRSVKEDEDPLPLYRVVYSHDETENRLTLEFTAEGPPVQELITVRSQEYTFNEVREGEFTFTGSQDRVVLQVSPGIENLTLEVENQSEVKLEAEKPLMFWIHQLRQHEDPEQRIKAAQGLRRYADNPDLQLALLDILNSEDHPAVYAEALRTLSATTGGASGTEQLYLQRYDAEAPQGVQLALTEALSDYPGNESVISRLRSILLTTEEMDLKQTALTSLADVAEPDRFLSISRSLISDERAEPVVTQILRQLARNGNEEEAVSLAEPFLDSHQPFLLRNRILDLLLDYDTDPENWTERLTAWMDDPDPRVRFRILDGLQYLSSGQINERIDSQLFEEYDERVIRRLMELRR